MRVWPTRLSRGCLTFSHQLGPGPEIPQADRLRREGGRESVEGESGVPEGERESGRRGGREQREKGREEGGCLGYIEALRISVHYL